MKKLISCKYNFDNCCMELKFTDGSMIAIVATSGGVACFRSTIGCVINNQSVS